MAWITPADVAARLGPTVPADDPVIVAETDAAIALVQRCRATAGHVDDPDIVPDAAVREAVTLYAMSLYRQRAAADGLPSFAELETIPPPASVWPRVQSLADFPRPAAG